MLNPVEILVAGNGVSTVRLLEEIFNQVRFANTVSRVANAAEVLAVLERAAHFSAIPSPDLILFTPLLADPADPQSWSALIHDERFSHIPFILIVNSEADEQRLAAQHNIATGYTLYRPFDLDQLLKVVQRIDTLGLVISRTRPGSD